MASLRSPIALVLMIAVCACTTTATRRSAGGVIDDGTIAATVKTALAAEGQLDARHVEIEVARGIVHLSGFVARDAERIRATEIARAVQGVRDVVNRIELRTGAPP